MMNLSSKPNKFLKRLSVDAGLSPQSLLSTKLKRESMALQRDAQLYRQLPPIPSKSNLSHDDGYQTISKQISDLDTQKQIKTVFQKLSTKEGKITIEIVESCLMQLGQDPKYAADMIELLDHDGKEYVEEDVFVKFFSTRQVDLEEKKVPEIMEKKADLIKFIVDNNKMLKPLEDIKFCEKVIKQFITVDSRTLSNKQN